MLAFTASAWAQPRLANFTASPGEFQLSAATTITAVGELRPLADYLSPHLGCTSSENYSADGGVILEIDQKSDLPSEGYRLSVMPDHISITGRDYGGVFNGVQELFRRLPAEVYSMKGLSQTVTLPCGEVTDAPKFPYRGFMLDVCRTWSDKTRVKRYIDLLAYHNLNKLHLHLTDDEGWRIEIKSHPELTEIGGFRGGDSPIAAVYGKLNEKYGGYYTQEDMREIIAYAAARNIEIIPEIDLPGHSRAIGSVIREVRCPYVTDTVSTIGYDDRSAWCVAREENYVLLEEIVKEICALFPSKYVHVGGDEVRVGQWNRCLDCRALMQRKGIPDAHALQDVFQHRLNKILAANGKQPAVWNEAAERGSISKDNLVYGWHNLQACHNVIEKGYHTVMMTKEFFYIDMHQGKHEQGHDWAGIIDTKRVFEFNFAENGFSEEDVKKFVGFEAPFWSETYVSNNPEKDDYLDYMCFPRLCALARLGWNGDGEAWESYYKELREQHYDRLSAMQVHFRLFPPMVSYENELLTVTTDDNSDIYYLKDGREHRYTKPISTTEPHRYLFYTRYGSGISGEAADDSYYRRIYPAVTLTSSMEFTERFPTSNVEKYKGLTATTRGCRKGDWLLFTFDGGVSCREILVKTGYPQIIKCIFNSGYAEVSYDGTNFEKAGELTNGMITLYTEKKVRAIRVVSTSDGNGTSAVNIQPLKIKPRL